MPTDGCPLSAGCPIRKSPDQSSFDSSPGLIAAYHVLLRLLTPRHPPHTLSSLTALVRGCPSPDNVLPRVQATFESSILQIVLRSPTAFQPPPISAHLFRRLNHHPPCRDFAGLRMNRTPPSSRQASTLHIFTFQRTTRLPDPAPSRKPFQPAGRGYYSPAPRRQEREGYFFHDAAGHQIQRQSRPRKNNINYCQY